MTENRFSSMWLVLAVATFFKRSMKLWVVQFWQVDVTQIWFIDSNFIYSFLVPKQSLLEIVLLDWLFCIVLTNYITLTLSWWRSITYRNQFIDLLCKSVDWFLCDTDLRHERVTIILIWSWDKRTRISMYLVYFWCNTNANSSNGRPLNWFTNYEVSLSANTYIVFNV